MLSRSLILFLQEKIISSNRRLILFDFTYIFKKNQLLFYRSQLIQMSHLKQSQDEYSPKSKITMTPHESQEQISPKSFKKRTFLQKLFDNMKQEQKSNNLQKKLSKSMVLRRTESIKINRENFQQVLTTLAIRILKKNETGNQLVENILMFLKNSDEKINEEIGSIVIKIEYKKATIDILTPLKTIRRQIIAQIYRKPNPLYIIMFQIWYDYIESKYADTNFATPKQFKKSFFKDLTIFSQYIANIIFHLYRQWFYYIQKNKQIYPFLEKEFVPHLLTSHPLWVKNYKLILACLGEMPIKIDRTLPIKQFDIDPIFYYMKEQNDILFPKTTSVVIDLYNYHETKVKITKLRDLAKSLRQQIRDYQKQLIRQNKLKDYQQIDVDNAVGCFTYCILKSHRDGLEQSLDYLQLIFQDENSDSSTYLEQLGIGHIMATLKSAAVYLRQKSQQMAQHNQKKYF